MRRLPDTGEKQKYTTTFGEDADYTINPPYFLINGDGTITDTVTGLMWQQTDGGELTVENAVLYCDSLTLGGHTDWRLPTAHESFSILNHQYANPALDGTVFTKTSADYWWTADQQANDQTRIWVTNAGGGIGNHPKAETISAGGSKRFHVRAVRDPDAPQLISGQFMDIGNGTVTDSLTGLVWQKKPYPDSLTWEQAISYAEGLTLAGSGNWRLPNIKELQSITDVALIAPSVSTKVFDNMTVTKFWSSTTLPNQITKAWYLDTQFGITTYDFKTAKHSVICVRGGNDNSAEVKMKSSLGDFMVFPNPFTNSIRVENNESQISYELSNCLGQVVCRSNSHLLEHVENLAPGAYFIRVLGEKHVLLRVIKQ